MSTFAQWQPRYAEAGIPTFPVAGKSPRVRGYLKLGVVASGQLASKFPKSEAFGFACRRNRITILDIDAPDENLVADAMAEFGPSPVIVRSGSGNFQAWYRHNGERRRIRPDPGRPIDILGDGFVVAPPSAGNKGRYAFVQGGLDDIAKLPRMPAPMPPAGLPKENLRASDSSGIPRGRRNETLWRYCMGVARSINSFDELLALAGQHNASMMAEPLAHDEVVKTASSAWKKQISGQNWIGESRVIVTHSEIDSLVMAAPDAFILLALLRRHHHPDHEFAVANAMAEIMPAGGWHRKRFAKARSELVKARLLICVKAPSKKYGAASYKLAECSSRERDGEERREREEGVYLIGGQIWPPNDYTDDVWPTEGLATVQ